MGEESERTALGPYLAMTSPIFPYPIKKNRAGRMRSDALAAKGYPRKAAKDASETRIKITPKNSEAALAPS